MKMVKGLTKANASKYGIEVRTDLDFSDDGNHFKGFSYKGLPMTQCRTAGLCFLSIRVDYLHNNNFTYKTWMGTEEYNLCDEFDGVCEFDIDKLIENLEKVLAKVKELNDSASITKEQEDKVKAQVKKELAPLEEVMKFVSSLEFWKLSDYALRQIADYSRTVENKIKRGHRILNNFDSFELKEKLNLVDNLSCNPEDKMLNGNFYVEYIHKYALMTR